MVDEHYFSITAPIEVSDQFFGWVLGFGNDVKILKPQKECAFTYAITSV